MENQTRNTIEQLRNMAGDFSFFLKSHFKSLSDVEIILTVSEEDRYKLSAEVLKEAQSHSLIYPEFDPTKPVKFTQLRFFPFTLITLKEATNATATAEQSVR